MTWINFQHYTGVKWIARKQELFIEANLDYLSGPIETGPYLVDALYPDAYKFIQSSDIFRGTGLSLIKNKGILKSTELNSVFMHINCIETCISLYFNTYAPATPFYRYTYIILHIHSYLYVHKRHYAPIYMLQLARMIHFDSTQPRSPATIALVVVVPNNLCEWHLEGGITWNLLVGLVDPLVAISWSQKYLGCFVSL